MFISLLQYEQLTIHHHPVEKKLEHPEYKNKYLAYGEWPG